MIWMSGCVSKLWLLPVPLHVPIWIYTPRWTEELSSIVHRFCDLLCVRAIAYFSRDHWSCDLNATTFFFLWPECYNLGLQAKTKWKNSIYDGRFHCKILNCQGCSTATVSAKCVFLLEYVMGRLGLGWRYSSLMLRLIWEKDSLFRGQVRFVWESSKSLYKERRCIDLLKQELEGKSFIKVGPQLYFG